MPKVAREMSALEVSRLNTPGHYGIGGVAGLYVNDATAKSWVLRLMVGLQRRHIGIGGFPSVTLAQAKEKARQLREEVRMVMTRYNSERSLPVN
ncbi:MULTISPECIES: Arm DNA-binding domain-containing protein [Methylomonas]|uniref:Arm DNA-binding domain-containing protein n=1 Tax=Methylomonas TaxID=416 RepID=UPI0018D44D27|nr:MULTISPECIES: Arm DNA-binding domain-containing protein [Methylomonas]